MANYFSITGMTTVMAEKYRSFGFFIFRENDKKLELLLLKNGITSSLPMEYSIVKGGKEFRENNLQAIWRETYEEVRFTKNFLQILPIKPMTFSYKVTKNETKVLKSVTAYFAFLVQDRVPVLSNEHLEFKYFTEKEIELSNISTFLKKPYLKAFQEINKHKID